MKPLCFIAAQGKAKGIKSNNLKLLAGKPLLAYTIESAINSNLFSHVIVSTENNEIAQVSEEFGAEIPFKRPKFLSSEKMRMAEVMLHGIKELHSLGYEFEIFVNRDCTVPFIRNIDIKKSIQLLKIKKCQTVIGVYRQHLNPYHNIVEINSKGFLNISKKLRKKVRSRQEAPPVFQENGLHTYDVKKFLKAGKTLKSKSIPFEIPPITGLMIDTEFEFQIAKWILENRLLKSKQFTRRLGINNKPLKFN